MDIVLGIKNILKAAVALRNLCKQSVTQWPTVKLLRDKLIDDDNGKSYQCAQLNTGSFTVLQVEESCRKLALDDLAKLDEKMRERLDWSDSKLLRSILVFLETQTWVKHTNNVSADSILDDEDSDSSLEEVKKTVQHIATHFREPLLGKGLSTFSLPDEIEDIVEYARTYLSLSQTPYRKVWYKLCTCPDLTKWPNVIILMELCFSLPFFNGRVEQIFSSLKVVKTNRRARL